MKRQWERVRPKARKLPRLTAVLMPVMLAPEATQPWLAGEPIGLGPAQGDPLSIHPVDRHLNDRRDDQSDCVSALAVP